MRRSLCKMCDVWFIALRSDKVTAARSVGSVTSGNVARLPN